MQFVLVFLKASAITTLVFLPGSAVSVFFKASSTTTLVFLKVSALTVLDFLGFLNHNVSFPNVCAVSMLAF